MDYKIGDVITTSIGLETRTSVITNIEGENIIVGETFSTDPNTYWSTGRWLLDTVRHAKNSEKALYIQKLEER